MHIIQPETLSGTLAKTLWREKSRQDSHREYFIQRPVCENKCVSTISESANIHLRVHAFYTLLIFMVILIFWLLKNFGKIRGKCGMKVLWSEKNISNLHYNGYLYLKQPVCQTGYMEFKSFSIKKVNNLGLQQVQSSRLILRVRSEKWALRWHSTREYDRSCTLVSRTFRPESFYDCSRVQSRFSRGFITMDYSDNIPSSRWEINASSWYLNYSWRSCGILWWADRGLIGTVGCTLIEHLPMSSTLLLPSASTLWKTGKP